MIQVTELTKIYGATTAIQDLEFSIEQGQVVGFLGPNGAGKSTTMRILTGSLGATRGRAMLDGKDIFDHPREVKRRIGYLPEVPPLYPNMTVRDYVRFAGRIKGVDKPERAAEGVIERVGLAKVAHRVIDHLSKGYRQRVGLAQALVHDPDVLILDEPNSGLDPAQRVEIRALLQELAQDERTVILSTHVLADIEAICKRVIIINQGQLVAQDDIDALGGQARSVNLSVARPGEDLLAALRAVEGVTEVDELEPGALRVLTQGDRREALAAAAVPFGLLELSGRQRLEDIYLRLTQGGSL
ncbi:MAG: ABC transporter ATP-binding protein [Alphaproteobacteria bacterium]|nr:ABC transporter ATP-binding protein [Alphaproteobacteria bacterium]MCB9792362.1 ABC transporter ATP-binding protein [Alphaproteobacteria bacterium]